MRKRLVYIVVFILLFTTTNVLCWFGEGYLFSDLQWSPDGAKLLWESRFGSFGGMRDSSPRILMYNIFRDEIINLTFDTTIITPIDNKRYILDGLYGFSILLEDDTIERLLFCPDVGYVFAEFLNSDYKLQNLLYEVFNATSCNIISKNSLYKKNKQLVEDVYYVSYIKDNNSFLYIRKISNIIDNSQGLKERYDALYFYDIDTNKERELFRYDNIRWFNITPDGDTIILWVEKERQKTKSDSNLEKYREDPTTYMKYMEKYYKEMNKLLNEPREKIIKLDITGDDISSETLFKGDIEMIHHSSDILLSLEGYNILFKWIEKIDKESLARTPNDIEHISIINLNNNDLSELPYSDIEYPNWSPNNEKIVFTTENEYTDEKYICIFDVYIQTLVGWYQLPEEKTDNPNARLYQSQFSWSPIGDYIAFSTINEHYNRDYSDEFYHYTQFKNPTLHIIDVENETISSIDGVGGFDIVWFNSSQIIYDRNSHLFMYDLNTDEEKVLSPGSGNIIGFDEDGELIFQVENLEERHPQVWRVDIISGDFEPYPGDIETKTVESINTDDFIRIPSPNGKKVAVLNDGKLMLWNEDGSNPIVLCERHATTPIWSPTGEMLAWIRENDREDYYYPWTDIWIANSDGSGIEVVVETMTNYNINLYENN